MTNIKSNAIVLTKRNYHGQKKNLLPGRRNTIILLSCFLLGVVACSKNSSYSSNYPSPTPPAPTITTNFDQTNLVADQASFGASIVDPNIGNPWGIASNPAGILWISENSKGLTTIYDSTGAQKLAPVAIPAGANHFGGSPTGIVFNGGTGFVIPATQKPGKFIFAGLDGTISAWSGGDSTLKVADRSTFGAEYTGLALAVDGNASFLYAANFKGNTIDVFDSTYTVVTNKPFSDPNMPAGFAPFNIQNLGGKLYVTYAKVSANGADVPAVGNGYVDIFNADGTLASRFASQGTLNSPWGIAKAPAGFGLTLHSILVGNFGDGKINVYDSTGVFKGQLQKNGNIISIDGLWAIFFPNSVNALADPNKLLFTAGPQGGSHGLLGYLKSE